MIELPMPLIEYDTILRSIRVGRTYQYGSTTAQILADRFDECDMPNHALLFRFRKSYRRQHWDINGEALVAHHPYELLDVGDPEELISAVHLSISQNFISRSTYRRLGIKIHQGSTIENPILESTK